MKTNDPNFKAGYTARMSDLPLSANPLLFDAAPREMWALGWQYAHLKKSEAALNAEPLERVPADPFEQGRNAYIKGLPIVDCPYGVGDPYGTPEERSTANARLVWRDGWKVAEQIEPPAVPVVNEYVADASAYHLGGSLYIQQMGRGFRKPNLNAQYGKLGFPGFMLRSEHDSRTKELLLVIDREVERRRVAERNLAVIADAVKGLDRDPNEV